MIRMLLDTDVILDYLLGREPFAEAASAIWRGNAAGLVEGYIAGITPLNVFYLVRKAKGLSGARDAVRQIMEALAICAVDDGALRSAIATPLRDFEDAVQHACAVAAGLDVIVTRNLRDYAGATLPVLSPADFITTHL